MAEAQLFSKLNNIESEIEHLPFGATSIAVSVSAIENIVPILNAISLAEAQLFSKLNNIESEIEHISCNGGATSIAINISAIENIQPILNAISLAEAQLFSELAIIQSDINIINNNVLFIINEVSVNDVIINSKLDLLIALQFGFVACT